MFQEHIRRDLEKHIGYEKYGQGSAELIGKGVHFQILLDPKRDDVSDVDSVPENRELVSANIEGRGRRMFRRVYLSKNANKYNTQRVGRTLPSILAMSRRSPALAERASWPRASFDI